MMPNRRIHGDLLGITDVVVSCAANTHFSGPSLAHCINLVSPGTLSWLPSLSIRDHRLPALAGAAKAVGPRRSARRIARIVQISRGTRCTVEP